MSSSGSQVPQGIKPEDIAKYNRELPMSTVSTPDLKSMEPEFDQRSGEPKSVISEAEKRGLDIGKEGHSVHRQAHQDAEKRLMEELHSKKA